MLCFYDMHETNAENPPVRMGGYARNFFSYSEYRNRSFAELLSRLRLKLDYRRSESLSSEIAYELVPSIGDHNDIMLIPASPSDPLSYRAFDIDEQIYPSDDDEESAIILLQNLDRAFATISYELLDLYVGRQPVAFGAARVINPTDIIAPYTYNTIAKEERIGVDAMRLKISTGQLGEFDIGYVFGEDLEYEKSAAFIRLRSYIFMTDLTVMTMMFRKNYLLGLDLVRSIGGAGAWIESAYVLAEEGSDDNYLRFSAGTDYSFTDKLYAYIEYHYNGAGEDKPDNYFKNLGKTAYTDGAVYLLSKHYIAPGMTYQVTPLLTFSGQALINMNDGSSLVSPSFEYSLADDVYSEIGAYIGMGDESNNPLAPRSEFGLYPDRFFISLNIYF
jgi:hypothetical protein